MTLQIGMLGSSQTGKTVWLCSLWWQLNHSKATPRLRLHCKDSASRGYIARGVEEIAEHGRFPGHTNAPTELAIALARPGAREVDLALRDYRGEDFDRAFADESAAGPAQELRAWVEGCSALLVFIAPFDLQSRAGSVSVRTLTVLEGLERALRARSARTRTSVRPHLAFVLTMTDVVPHVRSPEEVEAFLRACGLGTAIDSLAAIASSVAFFGASSLGRVERNGREFRPPADWKPVGVEEPVVWAEERLRSDRVRRRATVGALGLVSLLISFATIAAVERLDRRRALAPAADDPLALLESAKCAEAYASRWRRFAAHEARELARTRREKGDRLLWAEVAAAVSASLANPEDDSRSTHALARIERYLELAGAQREEARLLADSVRLARIERTPRGMERALERCRSEAAALKTESGRARLGELTRELEAHLESEDRARTLSIVERSVAERNLTTAIAAIDTYLAKHGRSEVATDLLARRHELADCREREALERVRSALPSAADDEARCAILRAFLETHDSGARSVEARKLLEEYEIRADDTAFARAREIGGRDTASLEGLVGRLCVYLARSKPRRREDAERLLRQTNNMKDVLGALSRSMPDPDAASRTIASALEAGGPFKAELERLARLWSSVAVTVRALATHVRRSHSEWFSDPDPRVVVSVGGHEVFRTREYKDTYEAVMDEPMRSFVYAPGQKIEILLEDVDVFGSKDIDRVTLSEVVSMDGTVAVGGSRVDFRLVSIEPRGAR